MIVIAFISGAIFSAYAGNIGMKIATRTNVRTTQAAKTSLPEALKISFGGGTVMGLGVAGLAVLGLTGFFIFFHNYCRRRKSYVNYFRGFCWIFGRIYRYLQELVEEYIPVPMLERI